MLNVQAANKYVPYQDLECKQMLADLLDKPDRYADHIKRFTYSFTAQMVFGFRTSDIQDPRLVHFYEGFDKFAKIVASQTSALLDLYPILRWLPEFCLPALMEARALGRTERAFYSGFWLESKTRIKNGTSTVSSILYVSFNQSTLTSRVPALLLRRYSQGSREGRLVGYSMRIYKWLCSRRWIGYNVSYRSASSFLMWLETEL